jgi:hypothetical protein
MQGLEAKNIQNEHTDDDPLDAVHNASSGAHITWGEGGVHSGTAIGGSWEASRILQGGYFCLCHSGQATQLRKIECLNPILRILIKTKLLPPYTYMQRSTPFLDTHVVALAQDGALGGDQSGADRYATLFGAFTCFREGSLEAFISLHV